MAEATLRARLDLTPTLDVGQVNVLLKALRDSLGALGRDVKPIDGAQLQAELQKAKLGADDVARSVDGIGESGKRIEQTGNKVSKAFAFNQIVDAVRTVSDALTDAIGVGVEFEASLAAVGAITGQSGAALDALGARARQLALDFGGSATGQLASFQGILSKMGPAVADSPEALGKLATNVNILSAASGDSAAQSMSAIVDSMLQLGLVSGDAAKDAETSTRVINALAAGAKVGAAEIPQVAAAMLQVGVAAKGAQLSLETTNAAIQVLAIGGQVGSTAGIGLRNVLGLIQNASGPAEASMRKLGTSSAELGKLLTEDGLEAALTKLKSGMDSVGSAAERNKALMEIFGSENSAAAGILLGNLDKLSEFEAGIKEGQQGIGSAFEQAAIRMNTSQSAISKAGAVAKDALLGIAQGAGQGISSALGTISSLAPSLTALSGLKDLVPAGLFDNLGKNIKDMVIPALTKLGVLRAASVGTVVAETVAEGANTGAKIAQTAATGGATIAQGALNAVMALNPAFLVVAGITALVGAFLLFSSSTKSLEDGLTDANAAMETFQKQNQQTQAVDKQASSLRKLSDEYDNLKGKTDPESQKRFAEVTTELKDKVPEAADAMKKLGDQGQFVGETYTINTKAVRGFADEQSRLAAEAKSNAMQDLDEQVAALGDSYIAASEKAVSLREEKKNLDALVDQGLGSASTDFGFDTVKGDLSDVNKELIEQKQQLDQARPQIEKIIDGYQDMGLSVEEIAKRTRLSVDLVKEFKGVIAGTVVPGQQLEKSIGNLPVLQQQALRQVTLQAEGYKAAQGEVDKLNEKIASQQALGLDTKELEKQLEEAEKTASGKKLVLQATISGDNAAGLKGADLFKGIDAEARKELGNLTTIVEDNIADAKEAAIQGDLGKALSEASKIKGKLDEGDEIGALVLKLQNAKTEAEKNDISAVIAAKVPSAISGYDQVTGAVQVSQQAVDEYVASQKQQFGSELQSQQQAFESGLKSQANTLAENRDRAAELQRAIVAGTKQGKDVSGLRAEYATLETKIKANTTSLGTTITQGKKFGLIKGDVRQVGTEFGLSSKQAQGTASAVQEIEGKAKDAKKQVGDMAEEFNKTQNAAKQAIVAAEGTLAILIAQKRAQLISEDEFNNQRKILIDRVTAAKDAVKIGSEDYKAAQRMLGTLQDQGSTVRRNSSEKKEDQESELQRAQRLAQEEQARLQRLFDRAKAERELANQQAGIEGTPTATRAEAQAELKLVQDQLDAVKKIFAVKGDGAIGISLKKGESRAEAEAIVFELQTNLIEAQKKVGGVTVDVKLTSADKIRGEQERILRQQVENGEKTFAQLEVFLSQDADRLRGKLEDLHDNMIHDLENQFAQRLITEDQFKASVEQIRNKETEEQIQTQKDLDARIKELTDSGYKRELVDLQDQQKQKEKILLEGAEQQKRIVEQVLRFAERVGKVSIDTDKDNALKKLDEQKTRELISEEAFNREKEQIERRAADAEEALQARIRGAQIEAERQSSLARLQVQRDQLEERLKIAQAAGKAEEAASIGKQLESMADEIQEKGSIMTGLTADLQGNLTDLFTNLFNGEEGAIKEPFRKAFATIAGALQQLATAKITEVLLSAIGPTGFVGLLASFALRPLIASLINSVMSPVIGSLTSFASGGRIDQPTLALIGDGSRLGGHDREWIFRDEQLRMMLAESIAASQMGMIGELRNVRSSIEGMNGRFYVLERDVSNARGRGKARVRRRVIFG